MNNTRKMEEKESSTMPYKIIIDHEKNLIVESQERIRTSKRKEKSHKDRNTSREF